MIWAMRRTSLAGFPCSIARTVDVAGEWWTPLILRDLFAGLARFEDIKRELGIAPNVLSDRLRRLHDEGIVERHRYQEKPDRFEYRLTQKGRELLPILLAIMAWGDKWTAGEEGPPVLLRHEECGHDAHGVVVCSHCQAALIAENVTARPGPGAPEYVGEALGVAEAAKEAASLRDQGPVEPPVRLIAAAADTSPRLRGRRPTAPQPSAGRRRRRAQGEGGKK